MRNVLRTVLGSLITIGMAAATVLGMSDKAAAGQNYETAQSNAGNALFTSHCGICHQVSTVTTKRASAEEWKRIVDRMIMNGAQISEPEEEAIVAYLAKTYGSEPNFGTQSEVSHHKLFVFNCRH